jgi:hypothetical protein
MQDQNIKILTLYPASNKAAPIECSVRPHSLSQSFSYEALSYTWGDPTDICPVPIKIDSSPTLVSTNLEAALRELRLNISPRVLWIDALCINQEDGPEKSRQIAMMGSIFASAVCVVIWLGIGNEESDYAMEIVRSISSVTDFDGITENGWKALEILFSRAWFKRIWVVQEFKRGRSLVFQCGNQSFNWDTAVVVMQQWCMSVNSIGQKHVKLLGEIGKVVSMASTRLDVPLDNSVDTHQAAGHLVRILRVYGGSQATEPRDKIYGLLGLSDAFAFPGCNPPAIDYSRPIEDVYRDWARFLIETQKVLDLLYISQRMEHDPNLPSWVPDWRKARHDLLLTLDVFQSSFKYTGPRVSVFDRVPYFHTDGRYLSIQGFVIITLNESFTFSDPDLNFIRSKLSSRPQIELLRACLMMGCKLKNMRGR